MKIIIAFACLLALAYANEEATVLKSSSEVNTDNFKYEYKVSNGIDTQQSGSLKGDALVVTGSYEYTSPEGEKVSVTYTADENGFHVDSANPPLPVAHPIPEAILRSIEYIKAHPIPENQN